MGKCPSCQKRGQRPRICSVCGKEGCEGCFTFLFSIVNKRKARLQNVYVCAQSCVDVLSKSIEKRIPLSEIKADGKTAPINSLIESAIFNLDIGIRFNEHVIREIQSNNSLHVFFHPFDYLIENPKNSLWSCLSRYTSIIQAKHYETMHEFENAAMIYKSLGMYEDAGRVRARTNELIIRKTDLSLDLNALLTQIKEGGIVAVYRCPHCNAALKIGGKSDLGSLKKCEHCGNEIEAIEIADFLKTALS